MKSCLILPFLASTALAAINDLCKGGGNTGTCQTTSWCDGRSGNHNVNGACPNDPNNVKCCIFPSCRSGAGFCDTTANSLCHHSEGSFVSGYCPGPASYQCCVVS